MILKCASESVDPKVLLFITYSGHPPLPLFHTMMASGLHKHWRGVPHGRLEVVVVEVRVVVDFVVVTIDERIVVEAEVDSELPMQWHLERVKKRRFNRMKTWSPSECVAEYTHHTYHGFPATSLSHTMKVSPWHRHGRGALQGGLDVVTVVTCAVVCLVVTEGAAVVAALEVVSLMVVTVAPTVVNPDAAMQRHLYRYKAQEEIKAKEQ